MLHSHLMGEGRAGAAEGMAFSVISAASQEYKSIRASTADPAITTVYSLGLLLMDSLNELRLPPRSIKAAASLNQGCRRPSPCPWLRAPWSTPFRPIALWQRGKLPSGCPAAPMTLGTSNGAAGAGGGSS